ncbi:MAG: glycosyltransferase family 2 protein [Clostridia bacterium]|nr:glycosyltransferase family 2 protein [Clostridia bacterium]
MDSIISLISRLFDYLISYIPDKISNICQTFWNVTNFESMNAFEIAKTLKNCWGHIITILLLYKTLYIIVGFFTTRRFRSAKKQHKYAILIAARNESTVIGNLIDSIKKQDYPAELITTFVVADNCTDNTAEIVRKNGAVCYERFDEENKTKGFALQFLLDRIEEDYGRLSFDGYFIFDADNLLKSDYVTRMNESFDEGEKIITSYRNTKNFDENWISASYAIHWLRTIRKTHRARSVFGLATNIQGTGFLFASELVKDGWKYTSLTEDRAFTADAVAQGYPISYNDSAEFYDEQPTCLKIALRQRIRWAKGHILAFVESGLQLFVNMFTAKDFKNRFMAFDVFMLITPRTLFAWARRIIVGALYIACYIHKGFFVTLFTVFWWRISWRLGNHFVAMIEAIYVFIMERKRIKKMSLLKKAWFAFTWPLFDIIGTVSMYIALFMKVTWKPIPHESCINIDDVSADMTEEREKEKTNV